MPEAEVDGLFSRTQIGKDGAQQFGKVHGVDIACGWGKGKSRRGRDPSRECNLMLLVYKSRASFLLQLLMFSHMFTKYHQNLTV
jgi:hypothetical protein